MRTFTEEELSKLGDLVESEISSFCRIEFRLESEPCAILSFPDLLSSPTTLYEESFFLGISNHPS